MSLNVKAAGIDAQGTALFLVVFGAIVTFVGCLHKWPELNTMGAGITGAGIQAIVTQFKTNPQPPGTIQDTKIEQTTATAGVESPK